MTTRFLNEWRLLLSEFRRREDVEELLEPSSFTRAPEPHDHAHFYQTQAC